MDGAYRRGDGVMDYNDVVLPCVCLYVFVYVCTSAFLSVETRDSTAQRTQDTEEESWDNHTLESPRIYPLGGRKEGFHLAGSSVLCVSKYITALAELLLFVLSLSLTTESSSHLQSSYVCVILCLCVAKPL
uniref:Uncharacterized protein n=1 Tax=Micrurus spixii TaxID=129469 RepID=A0A2D4LQZ9_9SAUR